MRVSNPLARNPETGLVVTGGEGLLSTSLVPRSLTALFLAASALGLLSVPIQLYDDAIVLLGARLVAAGRIPYVDFYSHYGPLGYTIVAFLTRFTRDPGLALRMGEVLLLAAIAILLHVLFRAWRRDCPVGEYAVPPLVAAFSQMSMLSAFFGFGMATVSLVLFLIGQNTRRKRAAILLQTGAGVALAVTALIRPAFAIYGAGALVFLELVAGRHSFGAWQSPLVALGALFGAAVLTLLLAGVFLYREIPPVLAFNATIVTPARLVGLSDARYLNPRFLPSGQTGIFGYPWAIVNGAVLAAGTILWTMVVSRRRVLSVAAAAMAAGGLLPLLLKLSERPGRDATALSLTFFFLTVCVAFVARRELRESALLRASATFGLAAAAFGHYFWARADSQHAVPMVTLSLAGAVPLLALASVLGRAALLSVCLLLHFSSVHTFFVPAAKLLKPEIRTGLRPWRCKVPPADARDAVAYADSQADPRSRFVAVGSSQAWSSANPVALFLLSSRPPYTRWFQYDPGLQSSPAVQKEMERELETSGSRTAVVWRAEEYLFDRERPGLKARSPFDDSFDRLYPITAARFGRYEVRIRASNAAASPDVRQVASR